MSSSSFISEIRGLINCAFIAHVCPAMLRYMQARTDAQLWPQRAKGPAITEPRLLPSQPTLLSAQEVCQHLTRDLLSEQDWCQRGALVTSTSTKVPTSKPERPCRLPLEFVFNDGLRQVEARFNA
eukprot:6327752-Amphidinium_carterae.1